jgi:hypothetical protein
MDFPGVWRVDRLTHHVHILEMNGESYRLQQSKQRQRTATAETVGNPVKAQYCSLCYPDCGVEIHPGCWLWCAGSQWIITHLAFDAARRWCTSKGWSWRAW